MIQDDWSLNYTTKKLSHESGSTRYTVNELYSWLMDLFDDPIQMDDQVPISAQTPVEYSLINGWEFNSDSDADYLYGGSIVVNKAGGDDVWANFYTLGTIASGSIVYWQQGSMLVAAHAGYVDGHIDQLIKVVSAGSAVDNRKITAYVRNLGNLYDHFQVTATATGGRNPVPVATAADSNDNSLGSAVVGVSVTFGTVAKDIGDGAGAVNYDVTIDGGGNSILDVYRYLKYITQRENTSPLNSIEGRFYQAANIAYAQKKQAPFGSFAGGKFFGAQGVWIEGVSDLNNRELIDAAGVSHVPPVSVTVVVTSVVSGDRVLVARESGGSILKDQFTIASVTTNSITTTEVIPGDIPATGTIRVGDVQFTYSGVAGSTFTGVSPNPTGQTGSFFVPLIDALASGTSVSSGSMIYSSDFSVIARVRKLGILPFENSGTVTAAGLTVSAIRTTDGIVS